MSPNVSPCAHYNRTSVELKSAEGVETAARRKDYNRTSVELKSPVVEDFFEVYNTIIVLAASLMLVCVCTSRVSGTYAMLNDECSMLFLPGFHVLCTTNIVCFYTAKSPQLQRERRKKWFVRTGMG